MDTWERLKIGAGVTITVALMLSVKGISDLAFPETYLAAPAYKIAGVSEPAPDLSALQTAWPAGLGAQGGPGKVRDYMSNIEKAVVPMGPGGPTVVAAPVPLLDLGTALAQADAAKGEQTARVCASCHTFDQGGQDRTGPNLYGLVGRDIASHGAFAYSSAFKAQAGAWTYERLDHYLTNPAKDVPGNKMAFAGVRKQSDRANLIAYLSTLSAKPAPFPKAEKPKAPEAPPADASAQSAPVGQLGLASSSAGPPGAGAPQQR
jgi:cytochrome c